MEITYAMLDPLGRVVPDAEFHADCPPLLGRAGMAPPEVVEGKVPAARAAVALEVLKPHALMVRGAYAVSAHD